MSADTEATTTAAGQTGVELAIGGMTCAACATRIEKKLNKLDGVTATVNYATERAVVSGPVTSEQAIAVVKKAGYTAIEATGDDSEMGRISAERVAMLRRRLAVAAVLTIPLGNLTIVLALVPELRFPLWEWLCVALAIPVVFWCAMPFHVATVRNLRNRSFSMDTLVSLGVLSAFTWSLLSIILGADDAEGYWLGYGITPAGADAIYFEVAAAVTTFLLAGRYFEARARRSAQGVLGALNSLAPKQVRRLAEDGTEEMVPIGELVSGQQFVVRPGERVAADGEVRAGFSTVDTSMMTGEPVPAEMRAPNLWLLDYREGGTFCVADPATLMLWRPHMESDELLKIEHGDRGETVAFVSGANFRKWPTDAVPIQYGVDYRLSGAGLTAPVTVRFAQVEAAPDTVEGSIDVLMAKGCTPQLDRLVDAMSEAEAAGG